MSHLLFLTPLLPSPTGGGSAIRAAATLEVLARHAPVWVIHAECWGDTPAVCDRTWCRSRAAAVEVVQPHRLRQIPEIVAELLAEAGDNASLEVIHVFRQLLAPVGLGCSERFGPKLTMLDLDDDDCGSQRGIVPLHERHGDHQRAAALAAEEARMRVMRAMLLARYDRVFLSNPDEWRAVAAEHPTAHVDLLPNGVPPVVLPEAIQRDPLRLLFLGTLSYIPNEDGVRWFLDAMWGALRMTEPGLTWRVVGVGLPAALQATLAAAAGVEAVGAVPEVGPEFAAAGMLVVPLRAGSGTRIKILEAFRHGTPVVSTSIGAAGLAVVDGEHLLLADTPAAMVEACMRLCRDAGLRDRLAAAAAAWVAREHGLEAMEAVLTGAMDAAGVGL